MFFRTKAPFSQTFMVPLLECHKILCFVSVVTGSDSHDKTMQPDCANKLVWIYFKGFIPYRGKLLYNQTLLLNKPTCISSSLVNIWQQEHVSN